jgi:hypothetical protein
MRRYQVRVALLTLGVLLGFGGAIARFGFGYRIGPDWEHHHGHHHHHHECCECDDDEAVPAPSSVQSAKPP